MTSHRDYPAAPVAFPLESAFRPYVNNREFRDAMASFGTTACLVTARCGEERLGRLVTSVFSLSIHPPSLLIAIDNTSPLADMIERTFGFSFAILSDTQQDIADAFAGRGQSATRFDNGRWLAWNSGHPRLADAVVTMDCDLIGAMETENHILFAGGVVDVDINSERMPLIWHQRQYKSVSTLSAAATATHDRKPQE